MYDNLQDLGQNQRNLLQGFQGLPRESYENCENCDIYENCENCEIHEAMRIAKTAKFTKSANFTIKCNTT